MKVFAGKPLFSVGEAALATLVAASLLAASLSLAAEQAKSPAAPPAFNNACRTCHSIKAGDHRIGPSLNQIFGSKAGSRQGFASSAAMKNSGFTWDEKTLDRFIENPDAVVPNNAMKPYGGLPDAQARKAIIDYLKTGSAETGSGKAGSAKTGSEG